MKILKSGDCIVKNFNNQPASCTIYKSEKMDIFKHVEENTFLRFAITINSYNGTACY